MDCKRALQETNGDIEAAVVLLREKGMAQRREARRPRDDRGPRRLHASPTTAPTGRWSPSAARRSPSRRATSSRRSRRRCSTPSTRAESTAPAQLEEERVELSAKLGENIAVAGAARFEAVDGAAIAAYAHPPANKLGVLVHVRGGDDDLARKLAMHIAPSSPQWIAREDVPEDSIDGRARDLSPTPTRCSRSPSRRVRRSSKGC